MLSLMIPLISFVNVFNILTYIRCITHQAPTLVHSDNNYTLIAIRGKKALNFITQDISNEFSQI